jgi:WD40 repeat protein
MPYDIYDHLSGYIYSCKGVTSVTKFLKACSQRTYSISMIAESGNVKVYTVNGATAGSSSSLPDWLTRKRTSGKGKRAAKEHVESTLELIQGFEFPEASNRVKTTYDGTHVIATGTYKPQIRVWDLNQLSLKFERHTDAENVDFVVRKLFASLEKTWSHSCILGFFPPSICRPLDAFGRLDKINTPTK